MLLATILSILTLCSSSYVGRNNLFPSKCCPKDSVLREVSGQIKCVEAKAPFSFLPDEMYNASRGGKVALPYAEEDVFESGMVDVRPDCVAKSAEQAIERPLVPTNNKKHRWKVLEMGENYFLTAESAIMSLEGGEFEPDFPLGDFCLDLMWHGGKGVGEDMRVFGNG